MRPLSSIETIQGLWDLAQQTARGVKPGIASSVTKRQWAAAQIYPVAGNPVLPLTTRQIAMLSLFLPISNHS